MENNLIGLDLLVNNKKTYKNNDYLNEEKKERKNILPLEQDIKEEIINIIKEKNFDIPSTNEEITEIDLIIDSMIVTLIDMIKYKYLIKNDISK